MEGNKAEMVGGVGLEDTGLAGERDGTGEDAPRVVGAGGMEVCEEAGLGIAEDDGSSVVGADPPGSLEQAGGGGDLVTRQNQVHVAHGPKGGRGVAVKQGGALDNHGGETGAGEMAKEGVEGAAALGVDKDELPAAWDVNVVERDDVGEVEPVLVEVMAPEGKEKSDGRGRGNGAPGGGLKEAANGGCVNRAQSGPA